MKTLDEVLENGEELPAVLYQQALQAGERAARAEAAERGEALPADEYRRRKDGGTETG